MAEAEKTTPLLIKRYASRRLYNTETSDYVTLDDIAGFIRAGRQVRIVDLKTGDDLTRQYLLQIIAEHEGRGESVLPIEVLVDLVRSEFVSEEARKFNDIVRPYVSRVTNEIQTVIQFYSGRVAEKRPEIIYLFGGNAHLTSLAELMEQAIGIPVRIWSDTPAIHVSVKAGALDVISYVNACAAFYRND